MLRINPTSLSKNLLILVDVAENNKVDDIDNKTVNLSKFNLNISAKQKTI